MDFFRDAVGAAACAIAGDPASSAVPAAVREVARKFRRVGMGEDMGSFGEELSVRWPELEVERLDLKPLDWA